MRTIRLLLYKETIQAVIFVSLGFLALFFFFDFVDELGQVGKSVKDSPFGAYKVQHAFLYILLLLPNHLYELLPISVLIGSVFVMARFAQSSEFTILRTSGLGPGLALKMLVGLGAIFVAFTFILGDYLAPFADRTAQLLKARYLGQISVGQTGAWLKEKQSKLSYSVNVSAMSSDAQMLGVRLFEFDASGRVVSLTTAKQASFALDNSWKLTDVHRRDYAVPTPLQNSNNTVVAQPPEVRSSIKHQQLETYRWPTEITASMVSVALLKPDRMGTIDLYKYIRHLDANAQLAQMYEIQFWKKVFYPLSCLVMLILALPFAYLHFRSGGITAYVFGGVLIGISFFVLNNIFDYFGNLNNWNPLLTAAAPGMVYSALSLVAFSVLVFRR